MKPEKSPPAPKPETDRVVALAERHVLKIDGQGRHVVVENLDGSGVHIEITPNGPVLRFDAPMMKIENSGDLCFEAGNISLRARGHLTQEVGGDLRMRAAGDFHLAVRDDAAIDAQAINLHAQRGELSLKATDDVALNGLRILHNVPSEEELIAQYEKAKTFGELMSCPAVDPQSPRRLPKSSPVKRETW